VVKAYENSIRQQEEHRLRLKKQERLKELQAIAAAGSAAKTIDHVTVEISSTNGRPQGALVYLTDVALLADGERVAVWPMEGDPFDPAAGTHLEREGTSWGDVAEWRGRICRPLLNYRRSFREWAGSCSCPAAPDSA